MSGVDAQLARAVRLYLLREAAAGRGGLWASAQRQASPGIPGTPGCPPSGSPGAIDLFEAPDLHDPGLARPPRPGDSLKSVAEEVEVCPKCTLSQSRTRAVPGNGTGRAGIVFVGEGPGAEEDRRGEPFVGAAGKLLDRILQAMDEKQLVPGVRLDRESVFVTNVVKCRPPANRVPLPQEIEACSPYLRRQLALLRPKVICCLGKTAAEYMLGAKGSLAGMRGTVHRYGESKLIVTYHPAALLRNPAYKRPLWEDMQLLASAYISD